MTKVTNFAQLIKIWQQLIKHFKSINYLFAKRALSANSQVIEQSSVLTFKYSRV